MNRQKSKPLTRLPEILRPLFWDYPFGRLRWETDAALVTDRVLARGHYDAIRWLRSKLGDNGLREWIIDRRGRGLSPRDLSFWQLVLRLPKRSVMEWLRDPGRQSWDNRRRA
jgi:hypothetical protein